MSTSISSVGRRIATTKFLEENNAQWSYMYEKKLHRPTMHQNLHQIAGLSDTPLTLHVPTKIFLGDEIVRK
jgi:hypothetical protein